MYVDLVGVVVSGSVEVVLSLVVACEGTVGCDDDEGRFFNDVLNDGSGRVASSPCSLPSPYSA